MLGLRGGRGERSRLKLERREEAMADVAEGDEEGEVA